MERIRDHAVDEREHEIDVPTSADAETGAVDDAAWRASSTRRMRRNAWFMLCVLAVGVVTVYLLSIGGSFFNRPQVTSTSGNTSKTSGAPSSTATAPVAASGQANTVAAQTRDFPMPQQNAGLMEGFVDAQGNVWFGEMFLNKLARLNPHTGVVTEWAPPNGQYGLMEATADAQGNIWFTEQTANYIGRFDPTTQRFTTYPLAKVRGISSGPQSLEFDPSGNLWFTLVNSGQIGRLNPTTGAIQTWNIPAPANGVRSYPYSLAITRDGQIWFGDLDGGAVGQLNPANGQVQLHHLSDPHAQVFAMTSDAHGHVWFTELEQGKIGTVDTRTSKVTEYAVPTTLGSPQGLYGVAVTANGDVWFACSNDNALIRFAPTSSAFTFYQLQTPQSVPYGVALGPDGNLWFTADTAPTNYVGMLHP